MKITLLLFLLISNSFAAEGQTPTEFFIQEAKNKEKKYLLNPYEEIISGTAALLIGNIGYIASDSAILKLAYSGIQTIGIINVGRGIYKFNSPTVEEQFKIILERRKSTAPISQDELAEDMLSLLAKEERAKRLALFYSSSTLSLQYFLNTTSIFDPPTKLKNIYFFMGGVNLIVALYSGFFKSNYENFKFGDKFDVNPFVYQEVGSDFQSGLLVNIRW